jgi:outer membrane immunogenic protein
MSGVEHMTKFAGFLLSSSVIALCASPVLAADLPYKAPPRSYAPAPIYSWSGMYIGGNVGYGWGKSNVDTLRSPSDIADYALRDLIGNFPQVDLNDVDLTSATLVDGDTGFSQSSRLKGIIGGAQIGFNVQSGAFVFGFETDFQGADQQASVSRADGFIINSTADIANPAGTAAGTLTGTTFTDYKTKIDWFGTVRGRVGVAADTVLFYATGGLAYGRVKIDGSTVTTGFGSGTFNPGNQPLGPVDLTDDFGSFGGSKVKFGWTLGAGIEWAMNNNWSFKAEYLYMDLGSLTVGGTSVGGIDYDVQAKFTNQIARVGINYKFGGSPF